MLSNVPKAIQLKAKGAWTGTLWPKANVGFDDTPGEQTTRQALTKLGQKP